MVNGKHSGILVSAVNLVVVESKRDSDSVYHLSMGESAVLDDQKKLGSATLVRTQVTFYS